MCCPHTTLLYFDGNKTVCESCGTEKHTIYRIGIEHTSHGSHCEPFYNSGYSRKKRMANMLEALFFPCACTPDEPILKHILHHPKFDTIPDICNFLKGLPVSDKRYLNLHFYCKMWLKGYTPHKITYPFATKRAILHWFERVELSYIRLFRNKPFLNYGWLLRVLLDKFELPGLKIYVKPLKCKKRARFYRQTYETVLADLRFPP